MQRLLVGIFGAAVVVAATLAASPASAAPPAASPAGSSPAAAATSFQNATIAAAMAKVPGGRRVSPGGVQWTSGMTLSVAAGPNQRAAAAAVNDCPTGDFCVWNGAGFGGTVEAQCPSAFFHGSTYFCPIWQVVTVVHSYSNKTAYRTWLQQNASHTNAGVELCINSRNFGGNTNSNYNGSSEFDGFAWMSDNTAACT